MCELLRVSNYASSYYVGTRVLKPLLAKAAGREERVADPSCELNRWFSSCRQRVIMEHRRCSSSANGVPVASPKLSVVIPVYNSAPTLPQLVQRLVPVLEGLDPHYEIVFIDDESTDDSWSMLCELKAASPTHITAIQLMRYFGQHNALMCGFRHSRGQCIVTMDDDHQNPPEDVAKLLKALESGEHDLVYGVYSRKAHGTWRNLGSALVNAFYRAVFRTGSR
jgi:cellulose synthase/poly-beta-1,6-N-acetylglucosamine synthase-like glycosyltransferase